MGLVESHAEAMVVTLTWADITGAQLEVFMVSNLARWWFVANSQIVCVPGRFLRFIARRAGISWWERWMLLQSGNGAMNVLKRTTLMKIETQLKIGTKPMKMLLRSPKIQKGCRMSFSRLGMAIYFTFTVVARNPWTRWQFRQAVLNTPLTTHWIFLGMLSWTMAISREKYGCDHRC